MNFSVSFLDKKVKIYKLIQNIYSRNIMCYSNIEDEITVYKYVSDDDSLFELNSIVFDPREYNIINIHEDIPGIDHVGIVNYISSLFMKENVPLLYINTYSYNLILISDEYIQLAKKILANL
jgi:hypothetical protein